MFIQYEKTTRKITGFQLFPTDKNTLPEGVQESGEELVIKSITDQARMDEIQNAFEQKLECTYATNGQIVVSDPAPVEQAPA